VRRGLAIYDDRFQARQGARRDAREDAGEVDVAVSRPHDERFYTCASDDVGQLGAPEAGIHRHRDGTEAGARKKTREPCRHVRQPQRDAVATTDAVVRERTRKPAALVLEHGNRYRPVPIDE
jgi:hypothetical protein